MKIAICMAALAAFLGTCYRSNGTLAGNGNVLEYRVQGDQYAVVIVREGGMSEKDARKLAHQRAAEITVDHGNQYFIVNSETKVEVLASDEDGSTSFNKNLYQEKIIQGDFGKEQLNQSEAPSANMTPALRIIFTMYSEKPAFRSMDACKYTDCSH